MPNVNLTQAAKLAGISRVTLHAHIKSGKLSTVIGDDGAKQIDPAEIMRVYGTLAHSKGNVSVQAEHPLHSTLQAENDALRIEAHLLRELLAERAEVVQALRSQIAMIEHKPAADPARPSWIVRLLTKKLS